MCYPGVAAVCWTRLRLPFHLIGNLISPGQDLDLTQTQTPPPFNLQHSQIPPQGRPRQQCSPVLSLHYQHPSAIPPLHTRKPANSVTIGHPFAPARLVADYILASPVHFLIRFEPCNSSRLPVLDTDTKQSTAIAFLRHSNPPPYSSVSSAAHDRPDATTNLIVRDAIDAIPAHRLDLFATGDWLSGSQRVGPFRSLRRNRYLFSPARKRMQL